MAQVHCQEKHGGDVGAGDDRVRKTLDHHPVDVQPPLGVEHLQEFGVRHPQGEMQEVVDHEGEDDEAADQDGARRVGRRQIVRYGVGRASI